MKQTNSLNRTIFYLLFGLVIINLILLVWIGFPYLEEQWAEEPSPTPLQIVPVTPSPKPSATSLSPTPTAIPITFPPDPDSLEAYRSQGIVVVSMADGAYTHLFAYHPQYLPFTRLTRNAWDDRNPAISPDGNRIAFSSHRGGAWDIYILDLQSNQTEQITQSLAYEGAPTWSPDGRWLAYEVFDGKDLNIAVASATDRTQAPIQITNEPGADYAPAWSPQGRVIAFTSNRSGRDEIWLARLDQAEDRFVNLSRDHATIDSYPAWSPDGSFLAWTAKDPLSGISTIQVGSINEPNAARQIGNGQRAYWSPAGDRLLVEVQAPNTTYFTMYQVPSGIVTLPMIAARGALFGADWKGGALPGFLASQLVQANTAPPAPLWKSVLALPGAGQSKRAGMVPQNELSAPYPLLSDTIDEGFQALRQKVAAEVGWDTLANLENAFVPLTTPLSPGLENDWLYTGRAFALNPLFMSAGWMSVQREDYNGQTFWRIFLKTRLQDGSTGAPVHAPLWDLNSRYAGDPKAYDQGGRPLPPPEGYWLDLTELAQRYGWERVPSLPNWRGYFSGIRFNQFVVKSGLSWSAAMAEVYPSEALATPTGIPTPTQSPTPTQTLTPTRTPLPTLTFTPTPQPTATETPQPSAQPSSTPEAALTPEGEATPAATPEATPTPEATEAQTPAAPSAEPSVTPSPEATGKP